ncbi:hypothetical protein DER29_0492 [Micromonospora sp. M71_S20]|uniref:hypothetical protein n=1 Tax=Micromonospora sp. M71_S20 TaxID=592872 RepID=UPI000EAE9BDF|nr:hypothetical protein [Micromonospora sp. M71_S20]RLK22654.1 hypothetical protein DER29_0492 [Micromonospora sp. M71_S20]
MTVTTEADLMTATKDELGAALVKALRALRRVGDNRERRTELYRQVADASVDLREHFLTPDTGEPDWAGRSWAYREYVRDRYSEAGVSKDEARSIQASVRYHVSTRVRQRLTPEEVEDLGLRAENIAQRAQATRAVNSALLSSLGAGTPDENNPDVSRALAGAFVVLQRITPAEVAALDGQGRSQARAVLGRLLAHAEELHAAVAPE